MIKVRHTFKNFIFRVKKYIAVVVAPGLQNTEDGLANDNEQHFKFTGK